eukprot:TRINITY_DN2884_c0_g1_i1.p1 TRINITY_DN2884_c0_g1~~TRINITY_DN2884_c0_g1_i1.p1  ORF type:complete len:760 (+),score=204.03 TRINITY_DN2884_c0_g1_i1:157-2436(+)
MKDVLQRMKDVVQLDSKWYKAWHAWALVNTSVLEQGLQQGKAATELTHFIVAAVNAYFRSISLGGPLEPTKSALVLQDVLRLLTLWFRHGGIPEVEKELHEGFSTVNIDTWLLVVPQIIARVQSKNPAVYRLILKVMTDIGRQHPQALVYPLTVCAKSQSKDRREAARAILQNMRQHSSRLVDQASFVSQELIRVAIIWHEVWYEGLEEASKLYFGQHDIQGMLNILAPLHKMMRKTDTLREVSFQQAYGRDLAEAHEWCKSYQRTGNEGDINQAWELYYGVFKKINAVLYQQNLLNTLELQFSSPKLYEAKDLELAVPGMRHNVTIQSFCPELVVMPSKQRPRRFTIHGSDGREHKFLLKGHEDLRLDERVMQLFGLVNTLLQSAPVTAKMTLNIQRYPVIPLSANAGLIGWVDNCDTFHQLVKDFREKKKIALNVEIRHINEMVAQPPDAENLPLMRKVELFEHVMNNTTGHDLYKVLWLQSPNSEVWLERRINYARSLAAMSMVGYILGLGDRHPNNLMLQKFTGKVVHIDFGDCFEVAMHRDKFPERIPFRLTRMLVNAMEVSGIEGNFRSTCENVMRVLRENKDSVMAMLEAFAHDPLISWRLIATDKDKEGGAEGAPKTPAKAVDGEDGTNGTDGAGVPNPIGEIIEQQQQDQQEEQQVQAGKSARPDRAGLSVRAIDPAEVTVQQNEQVNARALGVIRRISDKLHGTDFRSAASVGDSESALAVPDQVQKLIAQATSVENLCQCYIGWCPFW